MGRRCAFLPLPTAGQLHSNRLDRYAKTLLSSTCHHMWQAQMSLRPLCRPTRGISACPQWLAACRAAAGSARPGPAVSGERHGGAADRHGQQAAAQEDGEGVAAGVAVARLQDLDAAVREEVQAVGPPVAVQRGAVVPDAEEAQHLRRRARPRELPPYGTCPCCARMLRAAARRRAALKLDALL